MSGFLSLLKNIIAGSPLNQEQLLKNNGMVIIGVLLAKVLKASLGPVIVEESIQILPPMCRRFLEQ